MLVATRNKATRRRTDDLDFRICGFEYAELDTGRAGPLSHLLNL
jgi:hypothetical protein